MINSIIKDVKFALRGLLKHPAFTAIAVVTLALGIGGSTSIFTVVNAALLRGLPYKSPDRLYHIWEQTPKQEFPKREFDRVVEPIFRQSEESGRHSRQEFASQDSSREFGARQSVKFSCRDQSDDRTATDDEHDRRETELILEAFTLEIGAGD